MGFLAIASSVVSTGTQLYDSIRGGGGGSGQDLGFGITCEGDHCIPPEQIKAAIEAASFTERRQLREGCVWNGWAGPEFPSDIGETPDQSCARLSFHTGGGAGGRFSDGEQCGRQWCLEMISKYGIAGGTGVAASDPTPTLDPTGTPPSDEGSLTDQLESLIRDWVDVPIESVRAGVEEGVRTTRERSAAASSAAQLSDTQILGIVAGVALLGFLISRFL